MRWWPGSSLARKISRARAKCSSGAVELLEDLQVVREQREVGGDLGVVRSVDLGVDLQNLFEERLRSGVVVPPLKDPGEVEEVDRDVGVAFAVELPVHGQRLAMEPLGFVELAALLGDERDAVPRRSDQGEVPFLLTQDQCLAEAGVGLSVLAGEVVEIAELGEAFGELRRGGAEKLAALGDRFDEQRPGRGMVAELTRERTEAVETLGDIDVARAEAAPAQLERALFERSAFGEPPEAAVDVPQGRKQARPHRGLRGELPFDTLGAALQQGQGVDRLAERSRRIRNVEQPDDEALDLGGLRGLETGAIALDRQRARLEGHRRRVSDREERRQRRGGGQRAVAAHPFPAALERIRPPCLHRATVEVPLEVGREVFRRGIAPLGVLVHGARHDGVDLGAETAREPQRASTPAGQPARRRTARRAARGPRRSVAPGSLHRRLAPAPEGN